MNIAISNIAWNQNETDRIFLLLQQLAIEGIEIAPTKIWEDPLGVQKNQLQEFKKMLAHYNLQVVALQSLLFKHPELQIFEHKQKRQQMLYYLEQIMKIAKGVGAKVLVFGSPKNRAIPSSLSIQNAHIIALDFFTQLGDIAKKYDVVVGIEPNPEKYGTNFLTTSADVITFVKELNHQAIRVHLDTGAMYINKENYPATIRKALPYLCHFHISHDNLDAITHAGIDHAIIAQTLRTGGYNKWVSIEMRNMPTDNYDQIKEALLLVKKYYL